MGQRAAPQSLQEIIMKIYAIRASHNCRRVLATADYLEVVHEVIEVNPATGDLKKPEYLALNPNGKVPTLVDGDVTLWESNAIMQYIAGKKPSDFFPTANAARANITRWQFWEANHLSKGTGGLTYENVFKPFVLKQKTDPAAVETATQAFHQFAPVLNGALEGPSFIAGDLLTLADFSVGANFTYAAPAQMPLDRYPHIQKWLGRLDAVEAWKKHAPKLG
jgi:glutathione S-transferase